MMLPFPSIEIRQQFAKIGVETSRGSMSIRQHRADMEIETTPAKWEIETRQGELFIDQSGIWASMGLDNILELNQRIYSQSKEIALQGLARMVEDGNRMAAIHLEGNAIAEIARERMFQEVGVEVRAPASYPPVRMEYTVHKPHIQVKEGSLNIQARINPPEIEYTRGKLDIYMRQYASVEIIPPQIDFTK